MNRSGFNSLVCRGCEVGTGLERVVPNVSQKRACEGPGCVYEWWLVAPLMLDQELWDVGFVACGEPGPEEEVTEHQDE